MSLRNLFFYHGGPSEKFYEDRFVVIFDPNIKQVNGDPDKGDTWL